MVGVGGRVIAVDLQEGMIRGLKKRAKKTKYCNNLETVVCDEDSLCIKNYHNKIDFILLYAVLHEIKNKKKALSELFDVLKKNGKILFGEPNFVINQKAFDKSIDLAKKVDFCVANDQIKYKGFWKILEKK